MELYWLLSVCGEVGRLRCKGLKNILITFLLSSPDGSKYPFMPGFGIKDIVDSGSEADEKPNTSAPKKQKKLQSVVTMQF